MCIRTHGLNWGVRYLLLVTQSDHALLLPSNTDWWFCLSLRETSLSPNMIWSKSPCWLRTTNLYQMITRMPHTSCCLWCPFHHQTSTMGSPELSSPNPFVESLRVEKTTKIVQASTHHTMPTNPCTSWKFAKSDLQSNSFWCIKSKWEKITLRTS